MIIRIEGPYYGSYSLSIVNRSLAIALSKLKEMQVWISSTAAEEWHRDEETESTLRNTYNIKYIDCRDTPQPDVVIRNTWPIESTYLASTSKKIRYFAWEELRVPPKLIFDYNENYDEIWAPSEFVKRALIGSGIGIDVRVVPNAVNEIYSFFPIQNDNLCRFLHISSCFPRKSPEILVQAFVEEFSADEDVELVIKTFWNPHNNIKSVVEENRINKKNPPRIVVEESDLGDDQILDFYKSSNFFVFPSKGEGYGLPPEEAHAVGRPVIMPKSSSLRERFFEGVDFSVEFNGELTSAHLSVSHSIWYKPNLYSLRQALRLAYEEWLSDDKTGKYSNRIDAIKNFKVNRWDDVVAKLSSSLIPLGKHLPRKKSKICIISTFYQKCGIADYTEQLLRNFPGNAEAVEFLILSPFVEESKESALPTELKHLDISFMRCWNYWGDVFTSIKSVIENKEVDHIYIQHHTGFFSPNQLDLIIEYCSAIGIPCTITLHSLFQDFDKKHGTYSEVIKKRGNEACVFFVHSLDEYINGELEDWLFVLPQGVNSERPYAELRPNGVDLLGNSFLAASFGFLRRHKGIRELIEAWELVVHQIPSAKLLLLNSLHPAPDSAAEVEFCNKLISELDLGNSVHLFSNHLELSTIEGLLGYVDCVIFPYLPINEGSSAAVRTAISSSSAIICSDISLFSEFSDSVYRTNINKNSLADAVINIMNDRNLRETLRANAKKFAYENNWKDISRVYFSKFSR